MTQATGQIPSPVKISPDFSQRLTALRAKEQAFNMAARTAQEHIERRGQEIVREGQELWHEIAKEYSLDLKRVSYEPSEDGTIINPVSMVFA